MNPRVFVYASLSALALLGFVGAQNAQPGRANRDVETLERFGPRVAGTPTLERAANYLVGEYKKVGYEAHIQAFTYSRFEDAGSTLTVLGTKLNGSALYASSMEAVQGRLIAVPNSGNPEDYKGLKARGTVVLVRRGNITFEAKLRAAEAAGALGVVLVNSVPSTFQTRIYQPSSLPMIVVSGADGEPLFARATKENLTVRLTSKVERVSVAGKNVVAYLSGVTQPSLILGGHMDSVPGSPGANDNASGTAATLEIARRMMGTPLSKQTWFVSFDGEEDGLRGSRGFLDAQPDAFKTGLKGMLNFDMVGVNNSLAVGGSAKLVATVQGLNSGVGKFEDFNGSDHGSFIADGIPAVFFWRGYEPNYHQPGDVKTEAALIDETVELGLRTAQKWLETPGN